MDQLQQFEQLALLRSIHPGNQLQGVLFSIMYSVFIYALVGGSQQIVGFRIQPNGGLIPLAAVDFIPEGANGLAAR